VSVPLLKKKKNKTSKRREKWQKLKANTINLKDWHLKG